jgi:hypothetical protein
MAMRMSIALAQALANEITNKVESGSVNLYTGQSAAGGQPSDAEDSDGLSSTLLATFALSAVPFAAATDVNPGARIAAKDIVGVSAETSGVARWFRVFTSASAELWDGNVGSAGDGGVDMTLNNIDLDQDQLITINSWTITVPQSAA